MFKLRRPRHLVGPIFGHELTRLARRAQHTRLRAGLAAVLLATLFVLYLNTFPTADPIDVLTGLDAKVPTEHSARFAESFMRALLAVQLVAAILLTPIYAAGSVTEEIQRRSLEHLLATELSSREIVLGKFLARSLYVAGILLTGLPILALTQLWGGVDMVVLLLGYALIACTTASLAGLSLWVAVETGDLRAALLRVYALFVGVSVGSFCMLCWGPGGAFLSPFHVLYFLFTSNPGPAAVAVGVFSLFHLGLGVLGVGSAISGLRRAATTPERRVPPGGWTVPADLRSLGGPVNPEPGDPAPADHKLQAGQGAARPHAGLPPALDRPTDPTWALPPRHPPVDGDDPLLWKERYKRGPSNWESNPGVMTCLTSAGLVFFGILSSFVLIATIELAGAGDRLSNVYHPLARWLGLALLIWWVLSVGLAAAGSVSRERERQTLDGLLMLPVTRHELLLAKWRGAWGRGLPVGCGLCVLLGIATLGQGLSLLAAPLCLGLAAALATLAVSLGLYLSVRCGTSFRASVYVVVIALAAGLIPMALAEFTEAATRQASDAASGTAAAEFVYALGPVGAWERLTFPTWDTVFGDRVPLAGFVGALVSGPLMLLMAWVCWRAARRSFEWEGRT